MYFMVHMMEDEIAVMVTFGINQCGFFEQLLLLDIEFEYLKKLLFLRCWK